MTIHLPYFKIDGDLWDVKGKVGKIVRTGKMFSDQDRHLLSPHMWICAIQVARGQVWIEMRYITFEELDFT